MLFVLHITSFFLFFCFYSYRPHRHLHSFPTRRSSDLTEHSADSRGHREHEVVGGKEVLLESKNSCLETNKVLPLHFEDRKSTRLNSSHLVISYAVFCLKKKKRKYDIYI